MNLGIYIQVPFCQTKCTYCNFHTGVFAKALYRPYVEAVCREISETESTGDWVVDTVYVGGGTPSLLEVDGLAGMLATVRAAFDCRFNELTLEADPETVTPEKAVAWRTAGFDRVSLGAQSFNDLELRAAGRMHRREDIFNALRWLRQAGFGNISLDLIAGLPHQTQATWEDSLDNLIRLHPRHLSIYMMEIDDGSRLGREVLSGGRRYSAAALPGDEAIAEFYERASARLATEGYDHYEISNWALPGCRSRHNLKYWRREPYLGFGAGAHSFDGHRRWANVHDPAAYVRAIEQGRSPREQLERITSAQALEEELFLGLRLLDGIDVGRIEKQYNAQLRQRLERLQEAGLMEMEGPRARLASSRLTIANEVFVELMK